MLRNKKTGIKLFALLLVLLMTASVFAGCNTEAMEEAIEAAKNQADAANQSAAQAQAAADAAAKLADDLKKQLEDANKKIDEQKAANDKLQDELDKTKDELESLKNEPEPDPGMDEEEWEDISELITASVLTELSQLKVKYLTIRRLWYTEDNYYKLAKLFEDASAALYRATTADGVNEVLTKLADDAAKIPSIASEGEAVQALISNFGDVDTELFTTHEEAVKKAREDYIAWMQKYSNYFISVGFSVDAYIAENAPLSVITALDGYIMNTFNIATSTLRYAESKLDVLKNYANKVADEAYEAVNTILTNPTFADIKTKSAAIEAAYELYKIFVVANGGDDSPIQKKDADDKVLLTGEDFVKEYVLVLYDNWLAQYQSQAKAVIDSLPAFFMNNGVAAGEFTGLDTAYLGAYLDAEIKDNYKNYVITYGDLEELDSGDQQLLNEFQRIATLNTAEFLKFTFSGSFKGRLNIEAAYDEVDTAVAKAVAAMADLYYNKIIMPNIEEKVGAFKALATPYSESTDAKYKNFDKAFGTVVVNAVDAYLAELAQFKLPTYAELDNVATPTNGKTNISDLLMFNSEVDANGDVILTLNTNADTSAFIAILKAMKETVTDIADYYADAQVELDHMIDFYNFRKELSINVEKYASDFGKKDGDMVKLADDARGATKLSDNEKDNYNKAVTALGTSARDAIMALDYSTYTATTYQAKNTSNKPLYYQKSDRKLVTESKNNVALTIQVDKLVVAKDAAVDVAKSYLDQIFNTLVDLCRPQVTAYINAAKAAYASYQDDDSLNLTNDINAYVEYLTALPQVSTVARFVNDNFSNKNKKINTETYPTITDLTAEGTNYYLETVGTDQYIVHINGRNYDGDPNVINYAKAKSIIDLDDKNDKSYTYLSTAKFTEVCGMVLHDSDADVTTNGAYGYLDKVRLLAYYKDEVIMDIAKARDDVKGKWNASKGEWTTAPTYDYIYGSSRTARYLKEVDAVHDRLVEKVKAITMLTSGVDGNYTTAVSEVNDIYNLRFNESDKQVASKSKDDYSFKVAYDRYYATNPDGTMVYDWSKYYG